MEGEVEYTIRIQASGVAARDAVVAGELACDDETAIGQFQDLVDVVIRRSHGEHRIESAIGQQTDQVLAFLPVELQECARDPDALLKVHVQHAHTGRGT